MVLRLWILKARGFGDVREMPGGEEVRKLTRACEHCSEEYLSCNVCA